MKIYIACPANYATGGPELLHQLCYILREYKYDAMMYYLEYDSRKYSTPIHEAYVQYNNPYTLEFKDSQDSVIVTPEIYLSLCKKIKNAFKVFWWLSVDNFYSIEAGDFGKKIGLSRKNAYKIKAFFGKAEKMEWFNQKRMINCVQSEYAKQHLLYNGVDKNRVFYLSDYINPAFIKKQQTAKKYEKENIVLYNPSKGYRFTKKIIKYAPDFKWVALRDMNREQLALVLSRAKVYIDFGNHPGKDRLPRETAISGCCVITGVNGAAQFYKDIPISDEYKYKRSKRNIPLIVEKIKDIFDDYDYHIGAFKEYRDMIVNEEDMFRHDVKYVFEYISENMD